MYIAFSLPMSLASLAVRLLLSTCIDTHQMKCIQGGGWLFQGHPQAGASSGDVGEELRQGFFLAQLLKMSSRRWRMIPSMIGGPGHKVTSEWHCLSPSVPGPCLEAALWGLKSEQKLGLEP